MPERTSTDIRNSIERNRRELAVSVRHLQNEVTKATDWRAHIRNNRAPVLIGAAVAGFVIGGGVGAVAGRLFRRRR